MASILVIFLTPLFTVSAVWYGLGGYAASEPAVAQRRLGWSCCAGLLALLAAVLLAAGTTIAGFMELSVPNWLLLVLGAGCGLLGFLHVRRLLRDRRRLRAGYELIAVYVLCGCAAAAVFVTIGIIFSVLGESVRFFSIVPVQDFLFETEWSPQIAIREDQAGSSGKFGFIPLLAGTMLISLIAMLVAVPLGLFSAIYQAEFAPRGVRARVKPVLEFLAGIPTVVYGFFAVATLGPLLRDLGGTLGVAISSESALAAGFVIGVMTIPFVASLAEDALLRHPAGPAQRLAVAGRDQGRDRPAGRDPRGAAGHRRRLPAGLLPRGRRDHDRGDGRRAGGQPDRQPLRIGNHHHHPDRHPAGRRPGVRRPQDPGGLRLGPDAVRVHTADERPGAAHGPPLPREL